MTNTRKILTSYLIARVEFQAARKRMVPHWPELIRQATKGRGISLRSLAKQMGVSAAYLSHVQRGRIEMSPAAAEILDGYL
jgi:ribosome-binding protein aMBF1 (putative translation factor)